MLNTPVKTPNFKFHTCQMLKREHNWEYTAKLLKEHPMELLQPPPYMPPGRNKPLHWQKRGEKAEWRHLVCSVKDIKWEDQISLIWADLGHSNYQKQKAKFFTSKVSVF